MDASDLLGVQEAACFNIWHIWHEHVNGIYTVKNYVHTKYGITWVGFMQQA